MPAAVYASARALAPNQGYAFSDFTLDESGKKTLSMAVKELSTSFERTAHVEG